MKKVAAKFKGKEGVVIHVGGSMTIANPYATILSVAMMLRHSFGLETEARAIEFAVSAAVDRGVLTADIAPKGAAVDTRKAGQAVVDALA